MVDVNAPNHKMYCVRVLHWTLGWPYYDTLNYKRTVNIIFSIIAHILAELKLRVNTGHTTTIETSWKTGRWLVMMEHSNSSSGFSAQSFRLLYTLAQLCIIGLWDGPRSGFVVDKANISLAWTNVSSHFSVCLAPSISDATQYEWILMSYQRSCGTYSDPTCQ